MVEGLPQRDSLYWSALCHIFSLPESPPSLRKKLAAAGAEVDAVRAWRQRLQNWDNTTNDQLKKYSSQASASFLHSRPYQHSWFSRIAQDEALQVDYLTLQERLDNLRNSIRRPEVHF
jgi:hypothetical protein